MKTRILIARHGNTFTKGQATTRVGARTDLPLVESERGTLLGRYIKEKDILPVAVYSAPLKRTVETAKLAVKEMGVDIALEINDNFTEVDYGIDENKTEAEVMFRLGSEKLIDDGVDISSLTEVEIIAEGSKIIDLWNEKAIVPSGWKVNPEAIIKAWNDFALMVLEKYAGKNVLVVSSNGIIRFSPYLTGDFDKFSSEFDIKVDTGSLCIFEKEDADENWKAVAWNIKPKKYFEPKI